MSRHLPSVQQRPRVLPTVDNPYQVFLLVNYFSYQEDFDGKLFQVTTLPTTSNPYKTQSNGVAYPVTCRDGCCGPSRNQHCRDIAHDALLSDDTFTDTNTYYDYYQDNGYHTNPKRDGPSDCMFSEDSESTKLPYYEYENISPKRHSRNSSSDRSFNKKAQQLYRSNTLNPVLVHKDVRRVYPNDAVCDRLCPESQR